MTQEDKELLLKDLCARLPYHPVIGIHNDSWEGCMIGEYDNTMAFHHVEAFLCDRIEILPYLRPMSSMTDDERKYIEDKCAFTTIGPIGGNFGLVMPVIAAEWLTDFYNSRHLDWRGLIEKGLALEAPEGMYNIKNK